MSLIEARLNADGSVDEVVSQYGCASIHLEHMGGDRWHLVVDSGNERLAVNISAKRAIVYEAENVAIRTTEPQGASHD